MDRPSAFSRIKHCLERFFCLQRDARGATAVEFAIIAPVLFLLLCGTIEFSLIMFSKTVIEGANYEGSRLGKTGFAGEATPGSPPPNREEFIRGRIQARLGGLINQESLKVGACETELGDQDTCKPISFNAGASDKVVQYQTDYIWPVQTPLLGMIIGDRNCTGFGCIGKRTYTIRAKAIVKNERF